MDKPPEPLPTLDEFAERIGEAIRKTRREQREKEILRNLELMSLWADESGQLMAASDLDRLLPKDPRQIQALLYDGTLDVSLREKVLEVALMRGGSDPPPSPIFLTMADVYLQEGGRLGDARIAEQAYQQMARGVLMNMEGEERARLLNELSRSGDQLQQRAPATQLMHVLLQRDAPYGVGDERQLIDARRLVAEQIRSLPPETQGRMMYHLRDAVGASEQAQPRTYTATAGWKGVGIELSWQGGSSDHWKTTGDHIRLRIERDLEGKSDQDKRDFIAGYRAADPRLEDLPEY
jgi:hypothetical protein